MKKRVAFTIIIGMVWCLTGCGNTQSQPQADTQTGIEEDAQGNDDMEDAQDNDDTDAAQEGEAVTDTGHAENTQEGTTGEILLADFQTRIAENPELTPQELADAILKNSVIGFSTTTAQVQGNTLSGFSADIGDYEEGVMFGPMIGSIAFIGYIFTVPQDGDVDAFVETLKTNADPRWNICVEADETVVEAAGQRVFFLMCPSNLKE